MLYALYIEIILSEQECVNKNREAPTQVYSSS